MFVCGRSSSTGRFYPSHFALTTHEDTHDEHTDMVLNLTQIKETTEEVLILTPITLHQSRALLRLPHNIPKSLQITKDCFKIWVNMGRYELVLGVTGSVILTQ